MNLQNRNSSLTNIFLLLLMAFTLLFHSNTTHAEDYSNNIGFMKNPPKELKEKFPMCDQFLDVKWIRQFPDSNKEDNWIGRVITDIYEFDRKSLRELVVAERSPREDDIKLYVYDVNDSSHRGNELEMLIRSATRISAKSSFLEAETGTHNQRIKISNRPLTVSAAVKNGSCERSLTQFSQNICIVVPKEKAAWLLEKRLPFIIENRMNPEDRKKFEQLKSLLNRDCGKIINKSYCDKSSYKLGVLNENFFVCDDSDGDGVQDCYNSKIIAFLSDKKSFLMAKKKCSPYSHNGYYEAYGKQKEQRCVAEEKMKYLQSK